MTARPPWRNPWIVAFIVGAAALTALPAVQRLMLRAPAPLASLGTWSLPSLDNQAVLESKSLLGKPWLASFVPASCDSECGAATELFARSEGHLKDLIARVGMVTFVDPAARDAVASLTVRPSSTWWMLRTDSSDFGALRARFEAAWKVQTQRLTDQEIPFLSRPTIAVVDQRGDVRGFWPADEEGRGHAINAVRMFARHGAEP